MDRYELHRLQQEYLSHSQYSPPPESPTDRLFSWPETYHTLARERDLLDAALTAPTASPDSLADQVFGRQLHLSRLSLEHLGEFLYERCKLHYSHLKDIDHRQMKCQEYLFVWKINNRLDPGRRLSNLEGMLVQLESERRREELAFLADTFELRKAVAEKAHEYASMRDRLSILDSLGGKYG